MNQIPSREHRMLNARERAQGAIRRIVGQAKPNILFSLSILSKNNPGLWFEHDLDGIVGLVGQF